MELGYCWSLDFGGSLVVTPHGTNYVLVIVEHFSKWIELVALSQRSVDLAVAPFLDCVLAHFGAPAKVLTDQRKEFLDVFEELYIEAFIDHRTTLGNIRRQMAWLNGLFRQPNVEWLRKYGLLWGNHRDWDLMLPWIAMGNRFNKHASLAFYSPYQLLYGREPILPSYIQEKLTFVMDLNDPNIWAKFLHEQAQFFQRTIPMATENLSIAQHHSTLRYARICSGAYRPQLRRFQQRKIMNI